MKFLLLSLSFVSTAPLLACEMRPSRPTSSGTQEQSFSRYTHSSGTTTRLEALEDFTTTELVDLECKVEDLEHMQKNAQLAARLKHLKTSAEIATLKEAAAEREITRRHELARENAEIAQIKAMIQNQEKKHEAQMKEQKEASDTQISYLKWGLLAISAPLVALNLYSWYKNNNLDNIISSQDDRISSQYDRIKEQDKKIHQLSQIISSPKVTEKPIIVDKKPTELPKTPNTKPETSHEERITALEKANNDRPSFGMVQDSEGHKLEITFPNAGKVRIPAWWQ